MKHSWFVKNGNYNGSTSEIIVVYNYIIIANKITGVPVRK